MQAIELRNDRGMRARLITLGATLTELWVPDRNGDLADVVLGYPGVEGYESNPSYFGCTTGRVCNRIANARFELDGTVYELEANNAPHHLHGGGAHALHHALWQAEPFAHADGQAVRFRYRSPEGEENYPGNLDIEVTYVLTEDALRIDYRATTDRRTPVNLTHHSYFNLAGHDQGEVLAHELEVAADRYTAADETLIPTGELASVSGTPFDFRTASTIGARIAEVPGGYDLNYVVRRDGDGLVRAAEVYEPNSGRCLTVHTTEPGVQFYSGNFLDGSLVGKQDTAYAQYGGFCLEPQHYPDSINQPSFPSVVLSPGETYRQTSVYAFGTREN